MAESLQKKGAIGPLLAKRRWVLVPGIETNHRQPVRLHRQPFSHIRQGRKMEAVLRVHVGSRPRGREKVAWTGCRDRLRAQGSLGEAVGGFGSKKPRSWGSAGPGSSLQNNGEWPPGN